MQFVFLTLLLSVAYLGAEENNSDRQQVAAQQVAAQQVAEQQVARQPVAKQQMASSEPKKQKPVPQRKPAFAPFTGKVTSRRVRMRLQPHLDGHIYAELDKGDLLLLTEAVEDFYAVQPPESIKGYVFRTYVLDGIVEGQNVNVRLEPNLQSPVVIQLNTGDPVSGSISKKHSKWLEIDLPKKVRFYVSKDYIQRAGDADYFQEMQNRKKQLVASLNAIEKALEQEMRKPFAEIEIAPIASKLKTLINNNNDLPYLIENAEKLLHNLEKSYLDKSMFSQNTQEDPEEQEIAESMPKEPNILAIEDDEYYHAVKNPYWETQEKTLIALSIEEGKATSVQDFYVQDQENSIERIGMMQPYNKILRVRPGDFLLVNPKTELPIGFLYSTTVDLNGFVGEKVRVVMAERPDKNFAFPAYFVYKIEEELATAEEDAAT